MPEWVFPVLSLAVTLMITVGGFGWKLSNQFGNMKNDTYTKLEKVEENILNKLEYHERHDDTRFSDIKNDIWMLRLRAASNTGLLTEEEENNVRQERRNKISGRE